MTEQTSTRNWDFLGRVNVLAPISIFLVLTSIVLMWTPGPEYGIDFKGGTNIIARFTDDSVTDEEVREAVMEMGFGEAGVQSFGETNGEPQFLVQTEAVNMLTDESRQRFETTVSELFAEGEVVFEFDESSGDRVYVNLDEAALNSIPSGDEEFESEIAEAEARADAIVAMLNDALAEADFSDASAETSGGVRNGRFTVRLQAVQGVVEGQFQEAFGDRFAAIDRVETVGPRVGQQLRNDAIQAVLAALVAILLYIAVRFDLRYAPGAVAALFHDVMITLGIFVIIGEEISLPILAALLTIVGYSLNDTIVNYDRVRENLQLAESVSDFKALVNRSVNECFSRTILTSVTTLVAVTIIFLLGGGLIRSFALAMIIGVIVGTYSSIYIASPILVWTSNHLDKRAKAKEVEKKLA